MKLGAERSRCEAEFFAVAAGRHGCGGVLGLLPGGVVGNPGKHSLKLGIPGLKYGRPLAFKNGRIEDE